MPKTKKDFSDALKKNGLTKFFSKLPPSHQREYSKWLDEAKKPETRARRIKQAIKMITQKSA